MKDPSPLVSIVVPCFLGTHEHAALLDETLTSVSSQTYQNYEIVVVDDGSPVAASEVAAAYPKAVVVRQDNAGSAMARNTGIARSRGDYFVFLDADDLLLPPALSAGLNAFASHPECGFVVGGREEMTFEGLPVPWTVAAPPAETWLYRPLLAFDYHIIPPSSAMFRREVVEAVGGFRDPWGGDDLDFYLRAARHHAAHCFAEPKVTRYRRYSTSSSRDGERMLRSIRAVYDRQRSEVHNDPQLEAAFQRGLDLLTGIFQDCLIENVQDRLRAGNRAGAARAARLLAAESPGRWQALRDTDSAAASLLADPDGPGA